MKNLSIFDPESAEPRVDVARERLDVETAEKVAEYLNTATVVLRTTKRVPDLLSGDDTPVVRISTLTDGEYIWSEELTYYVKNYQLSPGEDFVEHCRRNGFTPPTLNKQQLQEAVQRATGG